MLIIIIAPIQLKLINVSFQVILHTQFLEKKKKVTAAIIDFIYIVLAIESFLDASFK